MPKIANRNPARRAMFIGFAQPVESVFFAKSDERGEVDALLTGKLVAQRVIFPCVATFYAGYFSLETSC